MAKGSTVKSGGTSRIRFVMVEAEIADGDIGQITQAIQNALRGPAPTVQRIASSNGTKVIAQETPELDAEVEVDDEDGVVVDVIPRQSKSKGPRKAAPTPNVLNFDLTSEPSLVSYAQKANPKSDRKRYLVIAAWFKEHRGLDAITADHVYTCYRSLKWPTSINDFGQALRKLKADQLLTSPEKGSYAINHLGIAEVEKLLSGGE
ncbi:hypothetical protein RB623_19045 [Mesorhizobium sp. LHD-90]|uniref:hypothetical protein n=1 Tax=Mesorhizobium sp. LHD-90 TaxID=3071414 RepID=UPI0027E11892|nr:hypothetical protein [Mesorhizobium sp. LHD-90]MDQ6436160.1 hypothetical protein [Mesorhizobium sp. LHD-90]